MPMYMVHKTIFWKGLPNWKWLGPVGPAALFIARAHVRIFSGMAKVYAAGKEQYESHVCAAY